MPRAKADSNKPRGRMTAYAYFMQTCRQEHKNKHPDENVVFLEFSKKCASEWKVINKIVTSLCVLTKILIIFLFKDDERQGQEEVPEHG